MGTREKHDKQGLFQVLYRRVVMYTKQYLSQIEILDNIIQNNFSEIYQLKTMACSVTVSNDSERVQTSSDKDRLGSTVAKIIDLEKETDRLVDSFIDLKKETMLIIRMIKSERHREILFKKYLEQKSLYEIAEELGMTDRGCKKAHKRALEEFEKIKTQYIVSLLTVHY